MSEVMHKTKKYKLINSYFKRKDVDDPDTVTQVMNYYDEEGELPFEYDGTELVYDIITEKQKVTGVYWDQHLTPPAVAKQIGQLSQSFQPASGKVLNACCGAGMIAKALHEEGLYVEGFDMDPEMVSICQRRIVQEQFYIDDFEKWADRGKWELIVSNPPLSSEMDKNIKYKFFKWLRDVMAPNGSAILILPKNFFNATHNTITKSILRSFESSYTLDLDEPLNSKLEGEIVVVKFSEYYLNVLKKEAQFDALVSPPTPDPLIPDAIEEAEPEIQKELFPDTVEEEKQDILTVQQEQPIQEQQQEPEIKSDVKPEHVNVVIKTNPFISVKEPIKADKRIYDIPLDRIRVNPDNPRSGKFDIKELDELAQNILNFGVQQPILLNDKGDDYEIIFGERRFRACIKAGLATIPARVVIKTPQEVLELALIENLQRKDIPPIEEAEAFQKIVNLRGATIDQTAEYFSKNKDYIRKRLALLSLIPELRDLLELKIINVTQAYEISRYTAFIQETIKKEHFDKEDGAGWENLSAKELKKRLEKAYMMKLSVNEFDKTECNACKFNTANQTLFSSTEEAYCSNPSCLIKKRDQHLEKLVKEVASGKEKIAVYVSPHEPSSIHKNKLRGLKIEKFTHEPIEEPKPPVEPQKEKYKDQKEFENDKARFLADQNDYSQEMWELENKLKNGELKKVLHVKGNTAQYGYIPVKVQEAAEVIIENEHDLRRQDQKNKEVLITNLVKDTKTLIKNRKFSDCELNTFEEDLLMYLMLPYIDSKYNPQFGIPESSVLGENGQERVYKELTPARRNLIKRNFIAHMLNQAKGKNFKSSCLCEFARLHFVNEYEAIESSYMLDYEQKLNEINEKIAKINAPVEKAPQLQKEESVTF